MACEFCTVCKCGVWWFSLILKMAYKIFIKGEELEDIRSDDDENGQVKKKQ